MDYPSIYHGMLLFVLISLFFFSKEIVAIVIQGKLICINCRYVVSFLKDHGKEVYIEVRSAYIDTMNKVNAIESTVNLGIKFAWTTLLKYISFMFMRSAIFFFPHLSGKVFPLFSFLFD